MSESGETIMAMPTLKEVSERRRELARRLQSEILRIEEEIVEGRDEGWVDRGGQQHRTPIYLIKGRVKSEESIYLKMRRKVRNDLQTLTDYAGIRVLVMFDEDLPDAMLFLLEQIIQAGMLIEITFFNLEKQKSDFVNAIKESLDRHKNALSIKESWITKEPSYRSIHFVFGRRLYGVNQKFPQFSEPGIVPVELQLRTLLQDVWAEMEHKLSYKQGKSDNSIIEEFNAFQSDVTNMGGRLAKIKERRDLNTRNNRDLLSRSRPHNYFLYEEDWDISKKIPKSNSELQYEYNKYTNLISGVNLSRDLIEIKKAREQLQRLKKTFEECLNETLLGCMIVKYYFEMEHAYLLFQEGKFDQASECYHHIRQCQEFQDRPVPHFRYGEILFIRGRDGDLLHALDSFDRAIALVKEPALSSGTSAVVKHYAAGIFTKVAAIYENMGSDEYFDYCIVLLSEALKFAVNISDKEAMGIQGFVPNNYANNLGWCYVEKFRSAFDLEEKKKWHELCLDVLIPVIEECIATVDGEGQAVKNFMDTSSWFLLQTHLFVKKHGRKAVSARMESVCQNANLLVFAKKMSQKMEQMRNKGPFPEISDERQSERQKLIRGTS